MTTTAPLTRYYSVADVARMLSVHPVTVRRWIYTGKLHAVKLGDTGENRISESEILRFLTPAGPHAA